MRISKGAARVVTAVVLTALAGGLCIALGFGLSAGPDFGRGHALSLQPALAFDGTATSATASLTPPAGLRATEGAPQIGLEAKQFSALQYAADQGHPSAQWKLGRMYADGDGVPRDDLRAFEYFSQIANLHADEPPGTQQALMVADAFVALGRYYLKGIPNSAVKPDRARARAMFAYAASYFGDADAQYELGRLYLDGKPSDEHEAARWLLLAATKGHCRAQVVLGDLLFRGRSVPRQAARGLMWLTLGRDCAGTDEGWVKPLYDSDIRHASDDERALALVYLKDWINGRRY
jgi:TPR repeat protein